LLKPRNRQIANRSPIEDAAMKTSTLKVVVVLLAVAPASFAEAQSSRSLTINGFSYHLERSHEPNEGNYGFGIEQSLSPEVAVTVGFYRNSRTARKATSAYGAFAYKPVVVGPIRAGLMFGAVTGYQLAPLLPAVAAVASYQGKEVGINVHLLPSLRTRSLGTIGVQLTQKF
jgi:hypothetical protein